MAELTCSRCGATAEGLERAPLPGEVGQAVLEQTCAECWRAWLGEQVKLINELRLSLAEPGSYGRLVEEMKRWLKIRQ